MGPEAKPTPMGIARLARDLLEQSKAKAAEAREHLERDERDAGRALAPLKPAADAIVIDSTARDVAAVVNEMKTRVLAVSRAL